MVVDISENEELQLADAAFALVEADPWAARGLAHTALRMARRNRAAEAEVAALHALSFAQHQLGEAQSITTIRRAVRTGERHGLTRRTAMARRRLALDLASRGAVSAAMIELDLACAALNAHDRARSEVFRVGVLWYAGTAAVPMAATDRALAILRRHGDAFWEAELLRNRGGLLLERGDTDAAEQDLMRAGALFLGLGARAAAIDIDLELARLALIQGDLPRCLARLDAIDPRDASPPVKAELALIRAQGAATARLRSEALVALKQAEAIWKQTNRDDHIGRLEAIRLTLLAGDAPAARELALRAQRSFAAQRREVNAARAAGLALLAAIASGSARRSDLRSGRRAVETLASAGWRPEAQRVRLAVARAALALGSLTVARREVAACAALRRSGSIADRIEFRHVEALMRLAAGDRAGAQRAASHGLGLLESHRETLGASDLRAAASEIGVELAQLGLRIALDAGDTASMLRWAERLRGSAMRLVPAIPPTDPELREHEINLRRVNSAARREAQAGRASQALRARQAQLEESIRRCARHATGAGPTLIDEPSHGQLAAALGDAVLLELIELDGTLTALTLSGGNLGRHRLGPMAAINEQQDWLRFALTRLAVSRRTRGQQDATAAGALASALALDRLLLEPLSEAMGNGPVVLVPTGALHTVPWAMLPSMRGRPLVVAPSAATWLGLQTRTRDARGNVVAVAGPRLRHSAAEAEGVAALYGSATMLSRKQATVAAVTEALDGARVAHLACHGNFRSDSPLFSSLELCDGPLNVYELQRLSRAPELIVLSGCDLAVSDTRPGDELLGFAAALIGMGSRTVIASVAPVPDAATKRLMIALHELLLAGESSAAALARAQAELGRTHAALAGFICLGTG